MDEKQAKTLKRVIKKLNALRKTLRKDERAMLDALIVRESEVTGHAMNVNAMNAGAMNAGMHLGDAMNAGAVQADAVSADAALAGAMSAGAVVADAVIGLASTGYVVELR